MSDTPSPSPTASPAWSLENFVFVLLVAALPLSFASGFTSYEPLKQGLLLVGGALLLLLWTLRSLRGQTLIMRGALALAPLVGLALYTAASAIWAVNPLAALVEAGRWFALLAVVLVVLDPLERPVQLAHTALALGLGLGGAALLGILQAFGVQLDAEAPSVLSEGLRASFDDQRIAALTIGAALPMLAAGLFAARGPARVVIGLGLALGAYYLGLANVTEAYIAVGVGVGVSILVIALGHGVHGLVPSYGALGALAAAAVLMAAGVFTAPGPPDRSNLPPELAGTKLERPNYAVDEVDWSRATPPVSDLGHRYAVSTGLAVFASHPAAGTGAGNYDAVAMGWADRSSPYYESVIAGRSTFRSAHNSYVQLLAELGVIGGVAFLLFLLIVFASLGQAMRKSARDSDEGQGLPLLHLFGLVGTFVALLVAFAFEDLLSQAVAGVLFFASGAFVLRESFTLLEGRGLARPWLLSRETSGAQGFERYFLAGLLPLAASILAIYLGSVATVADYYKARGDVWLRAGFLENAQTAFGESVAINPADDIAWFQLAEVAMVNSDLDTAESLTLKAIERRPYDPRLFAGLGNLQGRLALERGRKRMMEGNRPPPADPAKPTTPPAADDKPGAPPGGLPPIDANALLANIDRDTVAKAESNFNRSIELHPRYAAAYQGLGNLYVTDKRIDKAIATYLRALDKQPEERRRKIADLHIRIGQLYTVDEKWTDAERHFLSALRIFPEHPGRKNVMVDLEEIDARRSGKPLPKADDHDHGRGAVPFDVNKLRDQHRKEAEAAGEPHKDEAPAPAPAPGPAPTPAPTPAPPTEAPTAPPAEAPPAAP